MKDKHEKLENIINTESDDYITKLINEIKKVSLYFKKISIINQRIFQNSSEEYSKLHNMIEKKLEKLIKKFFIIINRDTEDFNMNNFNDIKNGVDDMLEKVSNNIDILKGIKKEKTDEEIKNEYKLVKEKEYKNINFKNENIIDINDIDNSYYPFIPKIKEKPNAKYPLNEDIINASKLREENKTYEINYSDSKNEKLRTFLFNNPYEKEIKDFINEEEEKYENLTNEYIESKNKENLIKFIEIKNSDNIDLNKFTFIYQKYLPLNESKLTYIEEEDELNKMLEKLEKLKEISIDLEHHSKESYLGITCLIQISDREEDYIIDALKLRNNLNKLNIILTNPKIIKIFHGGDYDIQWLQKDFGLYIVNMFDTGQASRILQFPSFSLKYLLESLCNYETDKKYQLADWRIRPLSKEMINYARCDTHFLLYIYDILKKKLIERSLNNNPNYPFNSLIECIKKSNEISMKSYQKPIVSYEFYSMNYSLYQSNRQISLLEEIFFFRDYVGRKLNLNPDTVLSKSMMIKLSKLKDFSIERIVLELGNSPLLRFINEFVNVCNNKIKEIEKEEKINSEDIIKKKELEYINKVKKLIENDEKKIIKFKRNINNENLEKNRKNIEQLMNNIKINNSLDFDLKKSKFGKNFESKKNKTINSPFNNFNLVNYLKNKHNILNIEMKISKEKNETNNNLNNKREIKREEEEEDELNNISLKEKEKIKNMNDITDNERIYRELQKNRIEQLNENNSDSDSEILEEEQEINIPKSFLKKEEKYKNYAKNHKNHNYRTEQQIKFRGKKRKK